MLCEFHGTCPVFKRLKTEALRQLYVRQYCEGERERCRRYQLRRAGSEVPERLLPDGKELSPFHFR
jgi:hypothetical protein